ncbi:uncharacterized protein LOC115218964 [Octopus sinensis]|uniref:Uncharacterized protein LOC115218964 n=1 Tax=Octopus sinensis TaxID=2607531 RepID=A0A7E6FBF0_9MOLL|nr:uncharacterized protein LOC115218964 [Octopus sinensis]
MVNNCWCVDHTYHVKENNDIHSFIGDIVTDTHLLDTVPSLDDNSKLMFNVLQRSSDETDQLFNVTQGGHLYTAAILDAEILCQCNVECFRMLEIAVQHGHSFIKLLKLKVIIEDVNDNSPKFPKKEFHLKFEENDFIGTKYIIPNAIDNDVSIQNSRITYKIEDLNTPFKLIVSKKLDGSDLLQLNLENVLDRETKSIYEIQLIARDNGSPQKKGVLHIKIIIKDINDNFPVFSQNTYNVTVNDTHQLNKPIAKLSATDLDEGENGLISYVFNSKTSTYAIKCFRLDEVTGYLFLKKEFQFGRIYKLFVEARDNGNPPMSSTTIVLVNGVTHLNNPPNIDFKFLLKSTGNTAVISEGTQIQSFVAFVNAIDNDSGVNGQVKCHLQNKYLQLVSMSEKNYKVVVKSEIDRESEKSFNFTIKCQDNGLPPLKVEKQFSVLVTDINDVQPQFSQDIFKFLTYENEHKDFPVGQVNATDPDIGDGGQLTYSLLSNGKDILPFQISDVGFISTTESLDREEKNLYEFKVLVKDKGTPSLEKRANVVVEVMDLNDNAPYFSFPNVDPFTLNVHYHPHSDHDITVVRASDRDSQHNAFLTYEILRGNEKHLFQMNHHSGVLSFSRSLYQNDAGFYELELGVKDSGSPVLSSTTTLSLTLTVSNNTSKIFKIPSKTTTESSNGLQLNVMIVIVVAAVIVSVVIVISISICIVHRLKQTDSNYNNSVDMYHKVTPALNTQSKYIFDPTCVPPGISYTMSRKLKPSQESNVYREDAYCRTMPCDKWNDFTLNRPEQMFIPREESMSPGYSELNNPDQFSEMSTLSSHTDSGHGWSVGSAGHYEELPDLCRYQSDQTWNRRNQLQNTLNRSRGDNKYGYHHHPNVDNNTSCSIDQTPLTITGTTSNITEQHSTVPVKSQFTSDCKPSLPAVPKITTLPKVPSSPQVPPPLPPLSATDVFLGTLHIYFPATDLKTVAMLYIVMLVLLMADNSWCVDHTYHVKENNDIHSYIGNIVTDAHLLHNIQSQDDSNKLTFNILQGGNDGDVQLFNVTPGGQIYTAAILDAEILCQYDVECFRILEIAVQHDHSFLKIIEIKVIIEDVNDNSPKFPNEEFHLKFDENDSIGTKYIIPNAIDNDVSIQNSRITYEIEDLNTPFKLIVSKELDGSDLLQLNLENVLDRETKSIYEIQLIARDNGSPQKEGVLHIKILVKDINDNKPLFSQKNYNVTVNDTHQLNKPIAKLSATDLDEGENGLISYFFNAITSKYTEQFFRLDEVTGYLFLKKEFQFGRIYKLYVEARDNGNPPMSSAATVLVTGISHLNNPPKIDVKFVIESTGNTAVISEASKIGSFVAYVKITDSDGGKNGQVNCHLHNKYLQLILISEKKYKVVVKSEIDRESEKSFNFTIKCQDNGLPPLKVEKQFSVLVTDINDVQPQFSQDIFKFLTYENEHKDFSVGYVNATDPDIGDGGQLTYSLLSNGKDILPFQISDVGFISTTESLDREEKNLYEFKVLVKDKGTPSLEKRANVVVEVMDLNDNAPYFSFPNVDPFSLNVHYHPHSDQDITVVRASDRDSQHNAFLTYEILRGNEKHLFQMNHHSGVLSFSRSLYQNDAGFYELELGVKDSGSPVLSSTTTLSLTLTVSNSTSKIFKTPSKTTTESSNGLQLNVMIVIVVAAVIVSVVIVISISICIVHRLKQTDNNYNNSVDMYHKVTPALNIQSKYIFDPTCVPPGVQCTMERNLKKPQQPIEDRENIYCRTMSADRWDDLTSRKQLMFIPREESIPPGYRELNGADQFSEMSTLSSHTDSGHGWSVGSAGHYEELPDLCRYQCDRTWNRRNPNFSNTLNRSRGDNHNGYHYQPNVDINTSCDHDQIPFTVTGTTSDISEQPSTVPMTSDFSSDCKPPLPPVPKVTTLPKVPTVLQVPSLSATDVKSYNGILAMFSMVLLIVVLVANNCWCVDHIYHVKENNDTDSYIGNIFTDTHLMDDIQSQFNRSKLTFNILRDSTDQTVQLFNVTPGGKLYSAAILDAESLCRYNVECFRIFDVAIQHDKSLIKILEFKFMIGDVNDNYPVFPNNEFQIQFDENVLAGTKEIIPNAIDNDVSIQNSKISYQLVENEDTSFKLFVSKKTDGSQLLQLNLEGNLDRETKSIYNLQLIATDGGSPPKEGILDIKILVEDKNDNFPVFSQNIYNVTLNDTHQMNKPIVRLSAADIDEGENGRISYAFSAKTLNKFKQCFTLDEITGEMHITKEYKFKKSYKLVVEARDNGKIPMSSTATVLINGVTHRNNPPNIDVKFVIESTGNTAVISEAAKIHSFVAYVKVTDNDNGKNCRVKCHLQNRYLQLILISKKKYKVVVKSEIDRESEKRFNFTIKCQDNGLPPLKVEKQFSMLVTDINDVQPQFSQDIFKFLTYENEHKDFPVGYVNATDPDIGDGGQLTYSLLSNGKDILPFQISDVGFISTTESLDREEKNLYEFKVLVKDKGTPSLEKRANVVVEVMDLNDNAPYFSFPNVDPFSLNVHYHPHSDHDITVVRASDRDSQHNAFLTYEILRGNEKHLFQMNHHSGVLSFSRSLYQNDAGFYELELGVKDSGSPVLSSTTTLSLTLTVSNSTSKIFKAPSKTTTESSNGLQLNVMIVIVIAAVIVSVVIVISISICIVHRLKQTDNNYESRSMFYNVTPALNMQSRYVSNPICVAPGVQNTMEKDLKESEQAMVYRKNSLYTAISGGRWEDLTLRRHQQMFVPRENMSPSYSGLNNTHQFSDMSTLSSCNDNGHGWSVSSAGQFVEMPDKYSYQCDHTQRNLLPYTLKRSSGGNNKGYPYQPDIGINTSSFPEQIPLTITGTTSNETEPLYEIPVTSQFASDCKSSLPTVPEIPVISQFTSDCESSFPTVPKVTTLPNRLSIPEVPPPPPLTNN